MAVSKFQKRMLFPAKAIWYIASFSMIGIAFNIKMFQAYMVLPAFYLFQWLAFKVNCQGEFR